MQVAFQDPRSSLNPRRTIRSAIGSVLSRHFALTRLQIHDRVAELLDNVGLSSYHMQRFPGELSGGQLQRVAIAKALAGEPDLGDRPGALGLPRVGVVPPLAGLHLGSARDDGAPALDDVP